MFATNVDRRDILLMIALVTFRRHQKATSSEQQYPLSFDQLVEFADKVPGESNILELIHKYTSDIEGVSTMLYEIFPSLEHKSIKNRCRKIQIKIKKSTVQHSR
jgi:uncharacterized glyoxalase superfamily metalloenzyme YdcJ